MGGRGQNPGNLNRRDPCCCLRASHSRVRYRGAARLDRGPIKATPDWIAARNSGLGWGSENVDFRRYLTEGKQQSILLLRQAVRGLEEEITHRGPLLKRPSS